MKRLIQVFLSPSNSPTPVISEVSIDSDTDTLYCTCPGFRSKKTCKHTEEVRSRIDENDGSYPLAISKTATQEEADKAMESEEEFHKFVVKYGKIEVF